VIEEDLPLFQKHVSGLTVGSSSTCEIRLRHKNGGVVWVASFAECVQESGQSDRGRLFAGLVDITARKQVEEEIKLNEARLVSLLRISQYESESIQNLLDFALNEAIELTQSKIGYIYFYDEVMRQFTLNTWSKGVMKECAIVEPQTVYHLENTGIWGEAVRQARPIVVNDFQMPHPLKKGYPDGHANLLKYLTIPVFSGDRIVAVVAVANKATDYNNADVRQLTLMMDSVWKIVERNQAKDEIIRQREELRGLATRLAEMEEIERQKLAGELHDDVCQNLASIGIILGILKLRVQQEPLDQLLSKLSDAVDLVEQTGEITRNIMEDLRPTVLDHYGLMGGLRQMGKQFSQRTGIALEVICEEPDSRLDPNVELALFRIAQEALNNVNKHARASHVAVTQEVDQDTVRLIISDNGTGFDQNLMTKPKAGRGWGLMTIKERAMAVGGTFRIESHPGQGTRVMVEVPH
jgi:signal transduction histidine kinase